MNSENFSARRADAQVQLVLDAFAAEGIGIGAEMAGDGADYLYEEGCILVRDAYLDRVRRVLGGGEVAHGLTGGVSLCTLEGAEIGKVTPALEAIDARLGIGVATPNHVLSVSPGFLCPATEPEVVPADAAPDPGVRAGGGGGGVCACVIDTGLLADAAEHPWLAGVTGDEEKLPAAADGYVEIPPYAGHGTFIAGVARCVAPAVDVRVMNVFSVAGVTLETEIARRLDQALGLAPDIISLSAGGTSRNDLPLLGFGMFWERYRQHKGTVLVAAAGNNSGRRPFWPAAFPDVVAVGALAADGRSRAVFSDYGPWIDVYAPGENLVNAYASGTYVYTEPPRAGSRAAFGGMARWSGTSFATPVVTGLVADRMSRTGENGRQAAGALLRSARASAIPGVGPVLRPLTRLGSAG